MKTRILAVVLLMGCGAGVECDEGAVDCAERCLSVCEAGHWKQVRCLKCEESLWVSSGVNECTIPRLPICATENQR